MNTPSYIVQRNNQTMVNFRPLYEQAGFSPRHFSEWISTRLEVSNLRPGSDFETFKHQRHIQYLMPVAVAMKVLDTLPNERTKSAKRLIVEGLKAIEPTGAENGAVEPSKAETLSLFVSGPESPTEPVKAAPLPTEQPEAVKGATVPQSAYNLPIPVYQIEGRAAVNAVDLYRLWNGPEERRLTGWLNYRIDKLGLVLGRHYVEYDIPPSPGHRRGFTGYILSLDAAISIAEHEKKGQGKPLAAGLIEYRKDLVKLRLPTKGSLADFIGVQPVNLPEESAEAEADYCTPAPVDAVVPEPVAAGIEDVAPLGPDAEPQTHRVPTPEELGEPVTIAADGTPLFDQPMVEPEPPADQLTPMFDLMVKFAQGLLQQAQALADQHREFVKTQQTVSALVGIEQEAARAMMGLHRGTAQIPTATMRDKIRFAVTSRINITGEEYDAVFKHIYKRLFSDFGYNIYDFPREKGETHLMACERWGLLDQVWHIVCSPEFNQYTAKQAA